YLRPVLRRPNGGRRGVRRGEFPRARPRISGGGNREGSRPPPSGSLSLLPRGLPRPRPRRRERVRCDASPADPGVVPRTGGDPLDGTVVPRVREVPPDRRTIPSKGGGLGALS